MIGSLKNPSIATKLYASGLYASGLIKKQAQDFKLLLAHVLGMGTYLYKYLITVNVLQRKIETVSNSLIIDMQTTNRISKQLSEIISMY